LSTVIFSYVLSFFYDMLLPCPSTPSTCDMPLQQQSGRVSQLFNSPQYLAVVPCWQWCRAGSGAWRCIERLCRCSGSARCRGCEGLQRLGFCLHYLFKIAGVGAWQRERAKAREALGLMKRPYPLVVVRIASCYYI
jgi:hypothetical protein